MGETQHLGGSGGMFPQEICLKINALRLILGHFLEHMHILANTLHFVVIMPNNVNTEWIWGGGMLLGGDIPGLPPPV